MPFSASELRDLKKTKADQAQKTLSDIAAEDREPTEQEQAEIDRLIGLAKNFEKQAARLDDLETIATSGESNSKPVETPLPQDPQRPVDTAERVRFKLPGPLQAFKERKDAYDSGQFLLAVLKGDDAAKEYCRANGIDIKATQTGGTDSAGGYTVPDPLSNAILDVRAEVGVSRQWARVLPMPSDTLKVPKRSSGPAVQYPSEGASITETNKSWAQVSLAVVKRALLTKISTELTQDSAIGVVDDMANEFGYQFAEQEDNELINGDGTSTYGSETGLLSAVGSAGVHDTGSGDTTWDSIEIGDFHTLIGLLPGKYHARAAWICSRAFHSNVIERLLVALGGNTLLMAESAGGRRQFLGYPILFSDQMPTATAVDSKCCVFGSGVDSTLIGDRMGVELATSADYAFDEDVVTIRGTTRYDINVHDAGDGSNAGAYVVMETAAS